MSTQYKNIKTILSSCVVTLLSLALIACGTNRYYIGVKESDAASQTSSVRFANEFKINEIDNKSFMTAKASTHEVILPPGKHKFTFRYETGGGRTGYDNVFIENLEAGKRYEMKVAFKYNVKQLVGQATEVYFKLEEIKKLSTKIIVL